MTSRIEKPGVVTGAIGLLYLTLVIGILRSLLEWSQLSQIASPGIALFILAFVFLITWWFINKMDQGRNWSRILFGLLFFLGIPLSIQPLLQSLSYSPVSGLLGVAQVGLQTLALLMLFSPPARPWFHPDSEPSSSFGFAFLVFLLLGGIALWWFYIRPNSSGGTVAAITFTPTVSTPAPQFASVAEAQREAVRLYPQLGVAGSQFNRAFLARYKQYQQAPASRIFH